MCIALSDSIFWSQTQHCTAKPSLLFIVCNISLCCCFLSHSLLSCLFISPLQCFNHHCQHTFRGVFTVKVFSMYKQLYTHSRVSKRQTCLLRAKKVLPLVNVFWHAGVVTENTTREPAHPTLQKRMLPHKKCCDREHIRPICQIILLIWASFVLNLSNLIYSEVKLLPLRH